MEQEKGPVTFTKEEVQKMMMDAFIRGEKTGNQDWYTITMEERADRAARECEAAYVGYCLEKAMART